MTNNEIIAIIVMVTVVGIVLWDMYKNEPIEQDKEQ
jgi:hypothetical protein